MYKSIFSGALMTTISLGGIIAPAFGAGCCLGGTASSPAVGCAAPAAAAATAPAPAPRWEGDVAVYESAGWKLCVAYAQKGTRSEGQNGQLFRDAQPVPPPAAAEVLTTPLGALKFYGTERKNLWDVTGWNFADRGSIKPAAELVPTPQAKAVEAEPVANAAAAAAGPVTVTFAQEGGAQAVTLASGSQLVVQLAGNPTTGYSWEALPAEGAALQAEGSEYTAGTPMRIGSGGMYKFTFSARAAGPATLGFQYRRSWEQGVAPITTAKVSVTVE